MMITESIMNSTRTFLESVRPDTTHLKKIVGYHKEIYKALKDKDLHAARATMKEHLIVTNQRLSEYFRKKPMGREDPGRAGGKAHACMTNP